MIGTALKWIAAFVLCLVLQTTLMPVVAVGGIAPDLIVVVLFFLAIRAGVMPGLYAGFLIGLGQDLYSPSLLGQSALAKTITGFFIGLFNEKVMRTDPVMKLILLVLSFMVHDTVFTVVTVIKTDASFPLVFSELFTRTLPRALYSVLIAAIVYAYDYFVKPGLNR
ncbi:MAG: rod shape-determining protein MreD [Chitinivibrionales bacterium]|nr:rod shape-determining protein MreD [Chitinivibrionales bacterium]MBD3396494.1 rod shape-determining protein MreD [Chitinivibrionales bacterium]